MCVCPGPILEGSKIGPGVHWQGPIARMCYRTTAWDKETIELLTRANNHFLFSTYLKMKVDRTVNSFLFTVQSVDLIVFNMGKKFTFFFFILCTCSTV